MNDSMKYWIPVLAVRLIYQFISCLLHIFFHIDFVMFDSSLFRLNMADLLIKNDTFSKNADMKI